MTKRYISVFLLAVLILAFILPGSGLARNSSQTAPAPTATVSPAAEFVPDQVLVHFKPGVTPQQANQAVAEEGMRHLRRIPALEVDVLQLPPGLSVERAVEVLSHRPGVAYAEPNYILHALAIDRAEIDDQWGLTKIQAPDAWVKIANPEPALLAIVDTGIDRFHSDLAANIWSNPRDPMNGLDDDGNGKIDDSWGWDFANGDNDPMDDHMHGTAVASVAAGAQDDSGVAGVCPWCTLAAVKVLGADGSGALDVVASGITYATDIGARVINLSLAGIIGSQALQSAVDYAWQNGALVVAAAGNDGANMLVYPAAYANAMAIGSTNEQDYRSCFSNYGQGYVSVGAPGEAILTATPNQGYGTYSGTSLSAPHATGLGGLLFSQDSSRSNFEVRDLIQATTNDLGSDGTDAFFGTGRINADRAVMNQRTPTSAPPGLFSDDLSTTGYGNARKLVRASNGDLHLIWHAKNGAQYQILYAVWGHSSASWSPPEVVFASADETFHAALAIDEDRNNLYVAFPSKHNASNIYRTYFTKKPLSGGVWSTAKALMGGSYHAVRPAIYYDPSGQRLHLVASSLDNASYVYYTSSGDGGESWDPIQSVNMGHNTRYAAIHANGRNVYIAARTVELTWFGLIPVFRVRTIRSTDGGLAWSDLTELAQSPFGASGDYGLSLAGAGDRLYLIYENAGGINFRLSQDGITWSAAESLGTGAWPSITQEAGGQAWTLWDSGGTIHLRHYTGAAWEAAEALGSGNYPNLKLGTSGGVVEWAYTHCSGAPFRLAYAFRTLGDNAPPQADDQAVPTDEEVPVDITLTGSDPEGDPLTFSVVSGPSHGTLSGSPPNLTYTPALNYNGADSFTFKANDGKTYSNIATVSITVNPVNDAPVAVDEAYITDEDIPLDVEAAGVLGNDTDVDGDGLTAVLDEGAANGTLTLNGDGSFTYTPDTNFTGLDTFSYHASDGTANSNVVTVSLTVNPVNDAPVAFDEAYITDEDTPLNVTASGVLGNDTDVENALLTAVLDGGPSNGALTLDPDGSFSYTPNADFNGTDTFTYHANDGLADSNVATVTLTVNPVNDAPMAADDGYTTDEDVTLTVAAPGVLGNDSDADGNSLTAVLVSDVSNGTLTLNTDGSFDYTPYADFNGPDSFTYVANDGLADSNVVTVTITVKAVNDPPVANDDTGTVAEGGTLSVEAPGVRGNDSDPDNDPLTVSSTPVTPPANGSLALNSDGSYTYTHDGSETSSDSFVYEVCDAGPLCDSATVSITVNPVNDPPAANDDSYTTDQDTTLNVDATLGVLTNDTDADPSDTLTATQVSGPANGTLTLNGDGSFSYTPDADFSGSDVFTYTASDGTVDSNSATVTITVSPAATIIDAVATSEILVAGTVSGDYMDTEENDGIAEEITERESGGKPANRYSYLEHKWIFNVSAGNIVTLYANAWSSGSSEGDSFIFAYSTNDVTYTDMFSVVSTSDDNLLTAYILSSSIQGTVYVRVTDSNHASGSLPLDTIYVDQLYIRSETQAGTPPAAPSGLNAPFISANQINLEWIDNATNEDGYFIERSEDGSNWTLIDTAGAGVTTYTDSTVFPSTTYDYRIRAYNGSGSSGYSNTVTATTPAGLNLTGTGYKVKGVQTVHLTWSGGNATSFDVYRDGNQINESVVSENEYTDDIGLKGGGSHRYQVCEAGSAANCSNMVEIGF